MPTTGCFERVFDADHLLAHPDQEVAELRMSFGLFTDYFELHETLKDSEPTPVAWVEALTASTPSTTADGTAGRHFERVLFCGVHASHQDDRTFSFDEMMGCSGECDGGRFVVLSANAREISVGMHGVYLSRLTECGGLDGGVTLGEWRAPVTYELFSVPDEHCIRDQS